MDDPNIKAINARSQHRAQTVRARRNPYQRQVFSDLHEIISLVVNSSNVSLPDDHPDQLELTKQKAYLKRCVENLENHLEIVELKLEHSANVTRLAQEVQNIISATFLLGRRGELTSREKAILEKNVKQAQSKGARKALADVVDIRKANRLRIIGPIIQKAAFHPDDPCRLLNFGRVYKLAFTALCAEGGKGVLLRKTKTGGEGENARSFKDEWSYDHKTFRSDVEELVKSGNFDRLPLGEQEG